MSSLVLNCCSNKPKFKITYELNDQYFVCEECSKKQAWSRHFKSKEIVSCD